MRVRFQLFLLLILLAVGPAAAQTLLPPSFEGWRSEPAVSVRTENLRDLAGEHAPILREYGAVSAERRLYARSGEQLAVTLYRMRDPTSAYGAFSFLRAEGMVPAELGSRAAWSSNRALILVGNLLLDAAVPNPAQRAADLKLLVAAVSTGADLGPYPTLENYLPEQGLLPGSDRFLLGPLALNTFLPLGAGDWLGFANGAEAHLARYRFRGEEMTLLLVSFPTPQAASRKLEELSRWFNVNAPDQPLAGRPVLFARRSSSLVALVSDTRSASAADALLQQIAYETVTTWNEPSFAVTEPPFSHMLVGVILGTGLLLLYTLAAGLAMGGLRVIIKRLFPGTVFDREKDIEILQLGLSSKPIDAKDFYQSPPA